MVSRGLLHSESPRTTRVFIHDWSDRHAHPDLNNCKYKNRGSYVSPTCPYTLNHLTCFHRITVTMMSRITINLKKESCASGSNSTFSWASKPNGYSPAARDISFNNSGAAWRQLPRKNIVKAERLFGVPPIPTNVTLAHDDTFELSIMVDKEVTILREWIFMYIFLYFSSLSLSEIHTCIHRSI